MSVYKLQKVWPLLIILSLTVKCSKERGEGITGITGITWKLYGLMEEGQNMIRPLAQGGELKMDDNGTFTLRYGGASCSGTYNWKAIDTSSAAVSFTVQTRGQEVLFIRKIMEGVNVCYRYNGRDAPRPGNFGMHITSALEFSGSAGYMQVYR